MAGATVATGVKVRTKTGLTSRPISHKYEDGASYARGDTITQSEYERIKSRGDTKRKSLKELSDAKKMKETEKSVEADTYHSVMGWGSGKESWQKLDENKMSKEQFNDYYRKSGQHDQDIKEAEKKVSRIESGLPKKEWLDYVLSGDQPNTNERSSVAKTKLDAAKRRLEKVKNGELINQKFNRLQKNTTTQSSATNNQPLKIGNKQVDLPKPLNNYSQLSVGHDPSLGWQVFDKSGDVLRQPKTDGKVSTHRFKERKSAENFAQKIMAKIAKK